MSSKFHHIRLLAGFELQPDSISRRVISRAQTEKLAAALAADLSRVMPEVEHPLLVACGSLLEPADLLQPGLPVWSAMLDLSRPLLRQDNPEAQVLAIGSHDGRLPDQRLAPPEPPVQGQFIGLPLLLSVAQELGPDIEQRLEAELFEQGGLAPPARALLEDSSGARSVHGQLLTVNDLLALQHVQMDVAGLSPFWSVVEQVLLGPDQDAEFELPGGLKARWIAEPGELLLEFLILDRYPRDPEQYPLWQRAFRSMSHLAAAHGLSWQLCCDDDLIHDSSEEILIHPTGPTDHAEGLTEHSAEGLGLIAWTVVEQGNMRHIYPLSAAAVVNTGERLMKTTAYGGKAQRLNFSPDSARLQPA